jgi:hypothetical protein
MDERLTKACEAEFTKFIEGLFKNPKMCGYRLAETPVIGGVYFVDNSNDDYATKIPLICAALAARERFRHEAPGFSELPLHLDDLMYAQWSTDPRTKLAGLFAYSLANVQWDYDQIDPGIFWKNIFHGSGERSRARPPPWTLSLAGRAGTLVG